MNRFLLLFVFPVLAVAGIPLTTVANPVSSNVPQGVTLATETARFESASYGKFNSLDDWTTEIGTLYPALKLIVKLEKPNFYFAVFSASSRNDRVAICWYDKPQTKGSSGESFDLIGKDGKSIYPPKSDGEDLTAEFKHQTSSIMVFPIVKGGRRVAFDDTYVVDYGQYSLVTNYTGTVRIELEHHVVGQFEITKLNP